jgi:hypothetical protein
MKRKIVDDPVCPVCEMELEMICHVLWECPTGRDAWGASCKKI